MSLLLSLLLLFLRLSTLKANAFLVLLRHFVTGYVLIIIAGMVPPPLLFTASDLEHIRIIKIFTFHYNSTQGSGIVLPTAHCTIMLWVSIFLDV